MRQEVAPFGVRVSIIEPGVTRTAILPKNVGHPTPTVYEPAYQRMLQFYASGIAANVRAEEVAGVIHGALEDPKGRFRYTCAWGGEELCAGRAEISDEEWIALGRHQEDSDYYAAFKDLFKLEIGPETR